MERIYIHPTADVSSDAKIGDGTKIWNNAQIREGAVIGKNCILGKDVYIDRKVKIGNNVKIQNTVSVYNGVSIEDDVFIGPHVTFTNDLYPRAFNKTWKIIPTLVKEGASISAGCIIICGITIGKYSMIGAGSCVINDVPDHGLVVGIPATLKGFVCFCGKKLPKKYIGKNSVKCELCNKEVYIKNSVKL